MRCGVKFCGGCNPRYERARALSELKSRFSRIVDFEYSEEDELYDMLLIIGGCPNCCASFEQCKTETGVIKMWDESHIESICSIIEKSIYAKGD